MTVEKIEMPKGWDAIESKLLKSSSSEVRELTQSLSLTFGSSAALAELPDTAKQCVHVESFAAYNRRMQASGRPFVPLARKDWDTEQSRLREQVQGARRGWFVRATTRRCSTIRSTHRSGRWSTG